MDRTDPDSWFEHEFNSYSAVADYANEPPRGMTNPPMNLALREVLCKDLDEFGLQLEAPHWGSGFIRTSSSVPTSPSQTQLFPGPQAHGAHTRMRLMHSYAENMRSGRVLQKGSIFSKSAPLVTAGVVATAEESAPVHPPWHGCHPFQRSLVPIDRRGPPCIDRTPKSVASACTEKAPQRSVRFEDSPKSLADCLTHGGHPGSNDPRSPTEFIKTPSHDKAIQLGKRMNLNDPSGKRPSSEPPGMAKKGKDSGKESHGGHGQKDEDDIAKNSHVIDESDLDNSMRGLRGMSQLTRAAVADRFRFGADSSAGEPMVLGASNLSNANPGNWSSDAACLTKFHNVAMRIVNPSGLAVLKETTSKRKKKKKKNPDEEEELKMGESGLFVARYPIDKALVSLRRARKKAFPEEEEVKPKASELAETKKAEAASKLKLDLGGCLLARLRESAEEKAEGEAALAASGYA